MGTGIALRPIWWVEQNGTELAIQVTHPEGARFADRAGSEAGAEVKVELATLAGAETPSRRTGWPGRRPRCGCGCVSRWPTAAW